MYFDAYETIECYKSKSYDLSENDGLTTVDDEIYIVGDEEYNEDNRQKLLKEDLDEIFNDLLSLDISTNQGLLSFVNRHGLPCSNAYATLDSFHEFYFAPYFTKRYPDIKVQSSISKKNFHDVCEIGKTRNSLLILQNLASLKELCDSNNEYIKNPIQALYSILNILIHFHFEDLFIQPEEELIQIRTATALFIQHLFQPNIIKKSSYSIDRILEGPIGSKNVITREGIIVPKNVTKQEETIVPKKVIKQEEIFLFASEYNNKQCFQLFRIVEILLDTCTEREITLQELIQMLKSKKENIERSIKKQMNLHKFSDVDLYNTACTIFTDLLFEGLNLCVPTYEKASNTISYKLKLKTILQGLYFHLYQFSGKLKRCPNCGVLFETTNKRQEYCSSSCNHNMRSRRSYYNKKNSSK